MNKKDKIIKVINISLLVVLLFSVITNINSFTSFAASTWRGYAVYRDGVVLNLNDHAALMYEGSKDDNLPILQAPGVGSVVKYDTWEGFIANGQYIGIYKPKNCNMTTTVANQFQSLARELRGISYTLWDQIDYYASSSMWVRPEHIGNLRCDGVIEYVYEWYGYKVGGIGDAWDITLNDNRNYLQHTGFLINPRRQHTELLQYIGSFEPK